MDEMKIAHNMAAELQDLVTSEKIGHCGYAFVIGSDGMILAHPKQDQI